MLTVLLDGWALAYESLSPAAVHVLEIIHALQSDVHFVLALPAEPPIPLPVNVELILRSTSNTSSGRLVWEQRALEDIGKKVGAGLLHLMVSSRPLIGKLPVVLSPAGWQSGAWLGEVYSAGEKVNAAQAASRGSQPRSGPLGTGQRVRQALFQGGLPRTTVCWPADLPLSSGLSAESFSPVIHPHFSGREDNVPGGPEAEFPETFVLYHGPDTLPVLQRVVETWRWAADAIGRSHPLLLAGLSPWGKKILVQLAAQAGIGETVQFLEDGPMAVLAAAYRRCSAFFYPLFPSPWGDPLRMALACAGPVVAVESPWSDALVGPAAYLVLAAGSEGETCRSLAGALITVVVEDEMAQSLVLSARQRAATWQEDDFRQGLLGVYQQVTSGFSTGVRRR